MEELHAGVSQVFAELESTLLTHPAHPSVHVQVCSEEFKGQIIAVARITEEDFSDEK